MDFGVAFAALEEDLSDPEPNEAEGGDADGEAEVGDADRIAAFSVGRALLAEHVV